MRSRALQCQRFARAFKSVSDESVTGFLAVMESMLDEKTIALLRHPPISKKQD